DGVEISTTGGHYVAIGLPASPYPLGGEARDVAADVKRLGGFGIAAHPDSPKIELQWRDWSVPIDGLELLNPDTSWRVHALEGGWRAKLRLARAIGTFAFRPAETITSLLTSSSSTLARWGELTATRRIVALAGVDAHAKLELLNGDPGDNRYSLPIPGYESSFRALSVRVRLPRPLQRSAASDAGALVGAIREGHLFTVVDGWATPGTFEFRATNESGTAWQGDELRAGSPVTLYIRSNMPDGFRASVWQDAAIIVADRSERSFQVTGSSEPAVYRVEIRDRRSPAALPWIVSNPIY